MPTVGQLTQFKERPPLVLIILDGWGIAPPGDTNAISLAKTPTLDYLWKNFPHTALYAHGSHVGLPDNQVGNSEAGHLNIGAGRVVLQDAVYITEAIRDGTFAKNPAFLDAVMHVKRYESRFHVMGILSGDQCPHMSLDHVEALFRFAAAHEVRAFLHLFTDGRDSSPYSAVTFWKQLRERLPKNSYEVATVAGRLYLDRRKDWSWTESIYNALVLGKAEYEARDFEEAVISAYARGESDEFISPTLIRNNHVTAHDTISDCDSVIFYNLRSDRARQLTKPFVQENFEEANQDSFKRLKALNNLKFVAMTDFGPDLEHVLTAFPSRDVFMTLPMVLGSYYEQLYITETEKYAHITYFLNGGYNEPVAREHRILAKSKDVTSYDQAPKMSCEEITGVIIESLKQRWYNFVCVNYPNADMLGHTGNTKACVEGCEAVDAAIGQILESVKSFSGELVVTADHGNAEIMGRVVGEQGKTVNTMHEATPVPFIIYTDKKLRLKGEDDHAPGGKLGDIAPTLLELVGIDKPKEMTGESLIL